jgi:hypothetical protein
MGVHHDLFCFFWQGIAAFRRKDFESAVEYFTQVTGSLFFVCSCMWWHDFLGGCSVSVCLSVCLPIHVSTTGGVAARSVSSKHMSAYVNIRRQTSACAAVSMREHASEYAAVSMSQHTCMGQHTCGAYLHKWRRMSGSLSLALFHTLSLYSLFLCLSLSAFLYTCCVCVCVCVCVEVWKCGSVCLCARTSIYAFNIIR